MKVLCWLSGEGKIEEKLENGKALVVPWGARVEWRVWRKNIKGTKVKIVVNGNCEKMKKSSKGMLRVGKIMEKAGFCKFFLSVKDERGWVDKEKQKFLVQPRIRINGKDLGVEGIRMQTNLSRCLGKIGEWGKSLAGQVEVGFNFFHLTSVNELGKYGSLYCIGDYSKLNNEFFTDNDLTEPQKLEELSGTIKKIGDLGGKLIVDLVLSHCSSINPIFLANPDAAYTLENTPHLSVAYTLDQILSTLSKDMSINPQNYKYRNQIDNIESLQYTMSIIKSQINSQNLFEYFLIDTEKTLKSFTDYLEPLSCVNNTDLLNYLKKHGLKKFIIEHTLLKKGWSRFGCEIKVKKLWNYCLVAGMSSNWVLREGIKVINEINSIQMTKFSGRLKKIFLNIENEIRYQKLELRVFEVSENNPLVKPYFTHLPSGLPVLLNGFIYSPRKFLEDISAKWDYLERNVITWRDCVKLNYGKDLKSCGEWINVIKDHTTTLASIFAGFRLDNCHGTPLWVTKYLVSECRKCNPDLLILAEFFSNSAETDTKYCSKIGINLLLRESLSHYSISTLSSALICNKENFLISSNIPTVLYDFTHDNPTVPQLRCTEDVVGNLIAVQFKLGAIGSTRGYDQVVPRQLSVVEEKRKYLENSHLVLNTPLHKLMDVTQGVKVYVEYIGRAASVEVFGDWDRWKIGLSLKNYDEVWRCCLEFPYSQIGIKYGFKFCVDKKNWICDQRQLFYKTWDGFINNLLKVESNLPSLPNLTLGLEELRYRMHLLRQIWKDFGYSELKIEEKNGDVLVGSVENILTQGKYWVVTKLAYQSERCSKVLLNLKGKHEKTEVFCKIEVVGEYIEDMENITGIPVQLKNLEFEKFGKLIKSNEEDCIEIEQFEIGSVLIVKSGVVCEFILENIEKKLDLLGDLDSSKYLIEGLLVEDFNRIIWRTEEQEVSGIYEFPKLGKLKFAGIGGILCALKGIDELDASHPIYENLYNGNWYMDYCINRLKGLNTDVFYYFLNDLFTLVKQLPRSFIPNILVKVLKTVFKFSKNAIYTYLIPCPQVPKTVLMFLTQIWTQFNIKQLCTLNPGTTLRFEHFLAIDLLIALNLPHLAKTLLIQSAIELNSTKTASTTIHFLYSLNLLENSSVSSILSTKIDSQTLQNFSENLIQYLINSSLDLESGLVLAKSGESWCNSSSRTGAFIELSGMLYAVLQFFLKIPTFPQDFYSGSIKVNLTEWTYLLKKSIKRLYYIPIDGLSLYIKPEFVNTKEIFKDTVGVENESEEYICSSNWFIAFGIAPELFNRVLAEKCWKRCWSVLNNGKGWVKQSENCNKEWIWIQYWALKGGVELGLVGADECWKVVQEIIWLMEHEWFGIYASVDKQVYSGLGYWGLIKTIRMLE